MSTETMNKEIREKLDPMVGKSFLYNHNQYQVKKYVIHADRERVFIHTDQKDFDRPFESIFDFIKLFQDVPEKPLQKAIAKPTAVSDTSNKESSIIVYETRDYSRFKFLNGNRVINERKTNKIINEIECGNDMLRYYPIQVSQANERLYILDGQHRFFICKKLKRPVFYILVEENKSMPDIAKVNSNVEKWKASDFINCYVQHGNENYKILQKFLDDYGISLTIALQMLNLGNPGLDSGAHAVLNDSFRNGTFEIKCLNEAETLAKECRLFAPFAHCSSRSFVIAIYRIKKAGLISLIDLLEAYLKRPEMLTQQASFKAYINTLEQIVNVGKKNRIVIV